MADFGISTLVDARQAQLTKDFFIYLVILCESQKKNKKKTKNERLCLVSASTFILELYLPL